MIIWRSQLVNGVLAAAVLVGQPAAPKESLVDRLLRIAGLTAAPSQMRGPAEEVSAGNIWIVDIGATSPKALTTDGGYRSPVFSPDAALVYALKGNVIVRLSPRGGAVGRVQDTRGVVKLVGFDARAPDEIVAVLDSGAGGPLGVVSLGSGKITPLPYNGKSNDEQRVLAQARGQDRVYGSTKVYLKTETKQGLSRASEWTDVYIQRADGPPRNISACDGVNCVQPALSPDGRSVVFIKADE